MSEGNVHQTSLMLGELMAASKEGQRQTAAMFNKLDDITQSIHEIGGVVKMQAEQHAALKTLVENEIKPKLDRLETLRQRGKGFAAGIGLVAGTAGAGLTALLAKIKTLPFPPTGSP